MSGWTEGQVGQMRGLTDREFRTLYSLARCETGNVIQAPVDTLAELMDCSPEDVARRVNEVCQKGLVGRLMLCMHRRHEEADRVLTVYGYFDEARGREDYLISRGSTPAKPGKKPVPNALRTAVFERDEYRCQAIGCGSFKDLRVDHIHPESRGGDLSMDNLQTLCGVCNSMKSNKVPFVEVEG